MELDLPDTRMLEELADSVVSQIDCKLSGDGCSFYVREHGSEGRFRLIATTAKEEVRFIGAETRDAFDEKAVNILKNDESPRDKTSRELRGFGITEYAIRLAILEGEGCLVRDVDKESRWSAINYTPDERDERCDFILCEVPASNLLSCMVVPILSKHRESTKYNPVGLIRIVRAKKRQDGSNNTQFLEEDYKYLMKIAKEIAPSFDTAVSVSYLATLGSIAIHTGEFWKDVIRKLSRIVDGTGASVFVLEEGEEEGKIKYICKATTGLWDEKGIKINDQRIFNNEIYYEEFIGENANSLTTWVAKNKRNVIVRRTHKGGEFKQYYRLGLNRQNRGSGRGRFNEHKDDISVIMVPVMSLDKKNVDAVVRVAKKRGPGKEGVGFSNQQVRLFLSVIPAISEIFVTSRRLALLENLDSPIIENEKQLYRQVVDMVPKLIGSPGCTLLVKREGKLVGEVSSATYIQKKIEKGSFEPYSFGQGYTGFAANSIDGLFFNDINEAAEKGAKWSGREYESEVGDTIITCDRFLAVRIPSPSGDQILGVIRTAKTSYQDEFTETDQMLLKLLAERLGSKIEYFETKLREHDRHAKQISNIFTKSLVDYCKDLQSVSYKEDIKLFFNNLEGSAGNVRLAVIEFTEQLFKKHKLSFDTGRQLYDFENNILGEVSGYRDHFVHQFLVFVLGSIIIDNLIDDTSIRLPTSKKLELEKGWIITANLHDIANTIARLEEWLPIVVGMILKGAKKVVPPSQFINTVLDPKEDYYRYLDRMGNILEKKTRYQKSSFVRHSLVRLDRGDHGLLAAISLLDQASQGDNELLTRCALAVALHTMALKDDGKKLRALDLRKIKFSELPLSFLLLYCDNIHEWARNLRNNTYNDTESDWRNLRIHIGKKPPPVLNKNRELKKQTGDKPGTIFVHTEMSVADQDFVSKKDRLDELFQVIESNNPVFSIELNNRVLFDSLTRRCYDL